MFDEGKAKYGDKNWQNAPSPIQMDEQGRLILSDEEIQRIANKVIAIIKEEENAGHELATRKRG
jgi:hypothetical protein